MVRTDHSSLTWLMNFKEPQGQLARWLEELSQYDMEIQYRPGSKHCNADALSRLPQKGPCPQFRVGIDLTELPCGGCPYCTRAHSNWARFAQEVDDVVPLAQKPPPEQTPSREGDPNLVGVSRIFVYREEGQMRIQTDPDPRGGPSVCEVGDGGVSLAPEELEQLKKAQARDPELEWVVRWRATGEEPPQGGTLPE